MRRLRWALWRGCENRDAAGTKDEDAFTRLDPALHNERTPSCQSRTGEGGRFKVGISFRGVREPCRRADDGISRETVDAVARYVAEVAVRRRAVRPVGKEA